MHYFIGIDVYKVTSRGVVAVDQKPNLIRHLHDLGGVWQTDITYILLTNHRWVYLATVLD